MKKRQAAKTRKSHPWPWTARLQKKLDGIYIPALAQPKSKKLTEGARFARMVALYSTRMSKEQADGQDRRLSKKLFNHAYGLDADFFRDFAENLNLGDLERRKLSAKLYCFMMQNYDIIDGFSKKVEVYNFCMKAGHLQGDEQANFYKLLREIGWPEHKANKN